MTIDEALELMGTLAAAYPRQELHDETLEIYARDLIDLDQGLARAAIERVRMGSRFFPTIAEIREAAAEIRLGVPTPLAAWEQASRGDPGGRHDLVVQARRMVGDEWDWRTGEAAALRQAFLAAYKEIRAATISEFVSPRTAIAAATEAPQLERG